MTVYPAIYCRKQFDVINYVTLLDAVLHYAASNTLIKLKLQKCIRMGITNSKFSFGEIYRPIYVRKTSFMAPFAHPRKT